MDNEAFREALPLLAGGLALLIAIAAHLRLSAIQRSLKLLQGSFDGKTLLDAVSTYVKEVRSIESDLQALSNRQEQLFAMLGKSARNLAIVRYDAFEEMGGRLSFSAALLDDHGDGITFTSINGRTESRVYAKEVRGGGSEHTLSPEEETAISQALGGRRRARR